jgi:hypothetical protein
VKQKLKSKIEGGLLLLLLLLFSFSEGFYPQVAKSLKRIERACRISLDGDWYLVTCSSSSSFFFRGKQNFFF